MNLIPTKPSIPAQTLNEYNIVVFGPAGIGKTSFAIEFPNTLLAQFEEGAKGLSCYKTNLIQKAKDEHGKDYKGKVWKMFTDLIFEILSGSHKFNFIAVDSIDRAYDFKMEYYKAKKGYHPGGKKDDYGQSWNEFNSGFKDAFYQLMQSRYGLVNISHATTKAIEDVRGDKYDKIVPAAGGKMGQWLIDEADIVLFYDYDIEGNRVLRVESDGNYEAKERLKFDVDVIPAGNSPKEAYQNFKKEFDKAINSLNDRLGITDEMIEEYYAEKEQEKQLDSLLNGIKQYIGNNNIESTKAKDVLVDNFDVGKLSQLNYNQAEEYLELLKQI